MIKTERMSVGEAIVRFLDNQYVEFDGKEEKFVEGVFTIFGHGCVLGVGEALSMGKHSLKVYQGKNEQGMAQAATAYAKQNNRRKIMPCVSSIGPGSANMVTAAGTATANNIPLLLLCGDTFATRQPDPVLQQIEHTYNPMITTNDAYKAVTRYFDRINRPEQVMSALINAMRVLLDPAHTGAVALALPQDVQGECYDYPADFFKKRVNRITRPVPVEEELNDLRRRRQVQRGWRERSGFLRKAQYTFLRNAGRQDGNQVISRAQRRRSRRNGQQQCKYACESVRSDYSRRHEIYGFYDGFQIALCG